jgi:hypothetical protein
MERLCESGDDSSTLLALLGRFTEPRVVALGYYDCMSTFTTKRGGAPITNEEARVVIETELFALKLTRPMTSAEKDAFCEIARSSLNYQSNSYRIREIRLWVESWQSLWLPEKLGPDEGGGRGDG